MTWESIDIRQQSALDIRTHVLRILCDQGEADFACFLSCVSFREAWHYTDVTCVGVPHLVHRFQALNGRKPALPGWSPELPLLTEVQSFSSLTVGTNPERGRHIVGLEGSDIADLAHAVIYKERHFIGLVVVVRSQGACYSPSELNVLNDALPQVADLLYTANNSEHLLHKRGRVLLHPDGSVELWGHQARKWLNPQRRRALGHHVAELVRQGPQRQGERTEVLLDGCLVELQPLSGAKGRFRYLATIMRAPLPMLHPKALLTPRQREVAMYAAAGATAGEIARTMGIKPSTVRDHLKEIYRRLGIGSRIELSQLLRPEED